MVRVITEGEFDHPAIVWAMYDSTNSDKVDEQIKAEGNWNDGYLESDEGRERLRAAYRSNELELDTDAPDGIHRFTVNEHGGDEVFYGIVVHDGKFDPMLTAHAIHIAMVTKKTDWFGGPDLHHRFVERVEWRPANVPSDSDNLGHFVVRLGS